MSYIQGLLDLKEERLTDEHYQGSWMCSNLCMAYFQMCKEHVLESPSCMIISLLLSFMNIDYFWGAKISNVVIFYWGPFEQDENVCTSGADPNLRYLQSENGMISKRYRWSCIKYRFKKLLLIRKWSSYISCALLTSSISDVFWATIPFEYSVF